MNYNEQLFKDSLSDTYFAWSQLCLQREYLNEKITKLEHTMNNIAENWQKMDYIRDNNLSYKKTAEVLNA